MCRIFVPSPKNSRLFIISFKVDDNLTYNAVVSLCNSHAKANCLLSILYFNKASRTIIKSISQFDIGITVNSQHYTCTRSNFHCPTHVDGYVE